MKHFIKIWSRQKRTTVLKKNQSKKESVFFMTETINFKATHQEENYPVIKNKERHRNCFQRFKSFPGNGNPCFTSVIRAFHVYLLMWKYTRIFDVRSTCSFDVASTCKVRWILCQNTWNTYVLHFTPTVYYTCNSARKNTRIIPFLSDWVVPTVSVNRNPYNPERVIHVWLGYFTCFSECVNIPVHMLLMCHI